MLNSFQKNKKGVVLMVLSSVLVCVGQLFWKLSVSSGIIFMLAGFLFYGMGALLMIYAYRFGKVSVLQPVLSLNYVISIFVASIVLKEEITLLKCIGILIIVTGVIFVVGGDEQ